ncbi:uncharacterized protein [Argopecten irradians]|uniref:uncharacterized protein n=1 Tax=Argopecten irradians TaxID=31199 RepID=UPI0037172E7B
MQTISEVKASAPGTNVTLKAMVLSVGDVSTQSAGPEKMSVVLGGDTSGSISATVYGLKNTSKFKKETAVLLFNGLMKDNYLAVTSRTEVARTQSFEVPDAIIKETPELFGNKQVMLQPISSALSSPDTSYASVKGKVVKVSPVSSRREIPYQELKIRDGSGAATLAVWEDDVQQYSVGQLVHFKKCKVMLYQGKKRLTTVRDGQSEILHHDEELDELTENSEDDKDEDFEEEGVFSGTITALFDVDPYLACPKPSCHNKKLNTILQGNYVMCCPSCNDKFGASHTNWYARATVLLDLGTSTKKLSIFKPEIQKIFVAKTNYQMLVWTEMTSMKSSSLFFLLKSDATSKAMP